MKSISPLEFTVKMIVRAEALPLVAEYQFHPIRKWRFDYADVDNKIAVELEGGVWNFGRHTRGKGFIEDTYKYNAATILGWRVLRYTSIVDINKDMLSDYKQLIIK